MTTIKGFRKADGKMKNRIIMSVSGLDKDGKTHFAFTAPGPIAYFDEDKRSEGVISQFVEEKQIDIFDITLHRIQDRAKDEWERLYEAYKKVLESSDYRTIVLDTGTALWELLRIARFGKVSNVKSHHYGPVNAEFNNFIQLPKDYDKNVIILHRLKKKYVDDKWKGDYERAGFGSMQYLVHADCVISKDREDEDEDNEFVLEVYRCGLNTNIEGKEYRGDMCSFPFVAYGMIRGSELEDWE